jgi:hypothetical protein
MERQQQQREGLAPIIAPNILELRKMELEAYKYAVQNGMLNTTS